jgi:hypothetical protein
VAKLDQAPTEKEYFQTETKLKPYFPSGRFNCWGVTNAMKPYFTQLEERDAVFFLPYIQGGEGEIQCICKIKLISPISLPETSRGLWPQTTAEEPFPWLFFFDAQVGSYPWSQYLSDLGYQQGHYRAGKLYCASPDLFDRYNGPSGYFEKIRLGGSFTLLHS